MEKIKSINENKNGAPFKFEPEELSKRINEYYIYVDSNPIIKKKVETSNKDTKETIEYIKRPYTLEGLYSFLDIDHKTFKNWENNKTFLPIVTRARQIIYNNKLEGAVAGVFNANIVALELGLIKRDSEVKPSILIPISSKEAKALLSNIADDYGELPPTEEAKIIDITHEDD